MNTLKRLWQSAAHKLAFMAIAGCALLIASCSSDEALTEPVVAGDPMEIRLNGELSMVGGDTRGAGIINGPTPTVAMDLALYRADETYSGTYALAAIDGTLAIGATTIGMTSAQYYQADPDKSTKFVALYPRPTGGTYTDNDRKVTYAAALDGSTDIMFGKLIEGSRGTPFSAATKMTFDHLLTQVQVKVKAENADAITTWGKVTSITIADKRVTPVVTLPASTSAVGTSAIINATGTPAALSVITTVAPLALPTADFGTYGYAMFLPVTSGKLTFNIITEKSGGEKSLTTSVAQDFKAGEAYNINITFTVSGITVIATLANWTNGADVNINL